MVFDFESNELCVGDKVVFAYNKFKTTKLMNGVIRSVDIKQFGRPVAEIEITNKGMASKITRCSSHNIYKVMR